MANVLQLGSKVTRRHDDGWGSPGCVMSRKGEKVRVYWPDENLFTAEFPSELVLYTGCASQCVSQPEEIAA